MKKLFYSTLLGRIILVFRIVRKLRDYKKYVTPENMEKALKAVFTWIDNYNLRKGEISPSFMLNINEIDEPFIKKFFDEAIAHGYKIIAEPSKDFPGYNIYRFKK